MPLLFWCENKLRLMISLDCNIHLGDTMGMLSYSLHHFRYFSGNTDDHFLVLVVPCTNFSTYVCMVHQYRGCVRGGTLDGGIVLGRTSVGLWFSRVFIWS